ncbi:MAG TPA: DUF6569 family protein, partial [Candidatus Krumholzibacterium sp.]|nr:DUF6569 family protein [Candidatus Krumholzibacterium sp.]
AFSKTSSITDAYKKSKKTIDEYRKNIVLPKGSTGILAVCGEDILGMDLFDSPKTMRKMWPRLSRSYFLEAAFRDKKKKALKATATGFMNALPPILRITSRPSGAGQELELSGEDYAGSGLWYNSRLCHLSAFMLKRD